MKLGSQCGRPMPSMPEPRAQVSVVSSPPAQAPRYWSKNRMLWIRAQYARRMPAVTHVAPQRGAGAAGPRTADDPRRHRMRLGLHLLEDGLGDVVVRPPVGGALGVGELVHEMAPALLRQSPGNFVDLGRLRDEMAAPTLELDRGDLVGRRRRRHHGDEGQAEQTREVGFGHRRRTTGRLDHRRTLAQPAVGQRIQEQRARQPVLQAAGRVAGFVLQIDVDAGKAGQRQRDQVGVGGPVVVRLDALDRLRRPVTRCRGHSWDSLPGADANAAQSWRVGGMCVVGREGFEPSTKRLKVFCSTD